YEIRKRVNVVKVELAVAIIDDVLNSSNLDVRFLHNALHLLNDLVRRRVTLDFQSGFWSVYGASTTRKLLASRGAADVGGAEIESFTGKMDLDAVEKLSAYHLDANNVSTASRDKFLHQRG